MLCYHVIVFYPDDYIKLRIAFIFRFSRIVNSIFVEITASREQIPNNLGWKFSPNFFNQLSTSIRVGGGSLEPGVRQRCFSFLQLDAYFFNRSLSDLLMPTSQDCNNAV